jgi:RNA-directed DNA polymerase
LDALSVAICETRVNWILDADIRGFFNGLSQDWLVRFLEHRIGDERILRLVRKWLKAGVLEDGQWSVSETGTPQGAVISPLLSNIYLTEVDRMLERAKAATLQGRHSAVEYARFADDLVVLVDAHPRHAWLRQAVPMRLRQELAKLHVEINEDKSTTVDLERGDSFGFLGFEFRRVRSLRGRWRPQFTPKLKKRTALLAKLRDIFRRYRSQPVQRVIELINPILRGWVAYFAVGHSRRCFSFVSQWVERKGDTCCEPGNARASAGRGGVGDGCTRRWGCSPATASGTTRRKRPRLDRSHNPCREARRRA